MDQWKKFKSFKQRGEWVELRFMAAERGLHVLKPWGDTRPYDIGIDHSPNFLRIQVKSTTCRTGTGYFCQFKPHYLKKQDYTLAQLDLFAAYVIPVKPGTSFPPPCSSAPNAKPASCSTPSNPSRKTATATKPTKKPGPSSTKAAAP
jgi:hypothetical protein